MSTTTPQFRANRQIRASRVQVIGPEGSNLGEMNLYEALNIARDASLDLVEVNGKASPAICKVMDFGKYKYDMKQKAKPQKVQQLKEMAFKVETDLHDLEIKAAKVVGWLADGDKVQVKLFFKGRQITHPDLGFQQVKTFLSLLTEGSYSLDRPLASSSLNGKVITLTLLPK